MLQEIEETHQYFEKQLTLLEKGESLDCTLEVIETAGRVEVVKLTEKCMEFEQ